MQNAINVIHCDKHPLVTIFGVRVVAAPAIIVTLSKTLLRIARISPIFLSEYIKNFVCFKARPFSGKWKEKQLSESCDLKQSFLLRKMKRVHIHTRTQAIRDLNDSLGMHSLLYRCLQTLHMEKNRNHYRWDSQFTSASTRYSINWRTKDRPHYLNSQQALFLRQTLMGVESVN